MDLGLKIMGAGNSSYEDLCRSEDSEHGDIVKIFSSHPLEDSRAMCRPTFIASE